MNLMKLRLRSGARVRSFIRKSLVVLNFTNVVNWGRKTDIFTKDDTFINSNMPYPEMVNNIVPIPIYVTSE